MVVPISASNQFLLYTSLPAAQRRGILSLPFVETQIAPGTGYGRQDAQVLYPLDEIGDPFVPGAVYLFAAVRKGALYAALSGEGTVGPHRSWRSTERRTYTEFLRTLLHDNNGERLRVDCDPQSTYLALGGLERKTSLGTALRIFSGKGSWELP